MYLFILESIGTSELILIAVVALIIFGPRKLPQMAKTIGKTMNEFRSATNEFKSTWAREVAFEEENTSQKVNSLAQDSVTTENSVGRDALPTPEENSIAAPQIRELSAEDTAQAFRNKEIKGMNTAAEDTKPSDAASGKRDWL